MKEPSIINIMVREVIGRKVVEVSRSVCLDQIAAITASTGRPVQLTLSF